MASDWIFARSGLGDAQNALDDVALRVRVELHMAPGPGGERTKAITRSPRGDADSGARPSGES